jgi:hypothetical protein
MNWIPCHAERIPIGSKWRERKPYNYRIVEVIGYDDETGKIFIRHAGRTTRAKASRFGSDYKFESYSRPIQSDSSSCRA